MAEKAESNNKKLIAIIAAAVVLIAGVVIAIILINKDKGNNNNNQGVVLNDDFFKSDDKKIVMSTTSNSTDPGVAKKVHQVYTVDGDKVTGLKVYSEFESEQAAKEADSKPEIEEAMKSGNYTDHKVEGKYIIVTMAESLYQSVTAEQLRMTAETLEKAIQNGVNDQTQTQTQTTEETKSTEETKTSESAESAEETEE